MRLAYVVVVLALVVTAGAVAGTRAPSRTLPLTARVIRPGEFQGFVTTEPVVLRRALHWANRERGLTPAERALRVAQLKQEGFVAGVAEDLVPARVDLDVAGVSAATQLRSAAGARAELAAAAAAAATRTGYSRFPVSGIPGARGYHLETDDVASDNVLFADRAFVYLVGTTSPAASTDTQLRSRLVTAASRLYRRVHHAAARPRRHRR